jgi:hypothetical protein
VRFAHHHKIVYKLHKGGQTEWANIPDKIHEKVTILFFFLYFPYHCVISKSKKYTLSNTTHWILIHSNTHFYTGDMFWLYRSHPQAYANVQTSTDCCTLVCEELTVCIYH